MQKLAFVLIINALCATFALGQTPTWATEVAPILYKHCVQCHRSDGAGPFSLVGYDNAFANRYSVQNATESRQMPPWKPDPSYRHLANENRLSDAEIQVIKNWVNADGPAGNLALSPADPVFPTGSAVGIPDQVLKTPVFTMTATKDEYRCFVVPNGLTKTAFLRGIEAIPSNHQAVHHILIYEDTTKQARALDQATPEPGYSNFGGVGVNSARLVGAWVPGARTILTPPNMGFKLTPGADLIMQVHFPVAAFGMTEQTTFNLFFTPTTTGVRELATAPLINHFPPSLDNYPLLIPANQTKTYHAKYKVQLPGSVLSIAPHMHLIGQNMVVFGITPQGDTLKLIRINDWDFHWQGSYGFQKIQKIPLGTTVHAYATYNNTASNPFNPSSPPKLVTQGEATTDEMFLVYFTYMLYQPGDENIVLDSTLLSSPTQEVPANFAFGKISISPNPTSERLAVEFNLLKTSDLQLAVLDASGRVVRFFAEKHEVAPGIVREETSVKDLPPGAYFVQLRAGQSIRAEAFVKHAN